MCYSSGVNTSERRTILETRYGSVLYDVKPWVTAVELCLIHRKGVGASPSLGAYSSEQIRTSLTVIERGQVHAAMTY